MIFMRFRGPQALNDTYKKPGGTSVKPKGVSLSGRFRPDLATRHSPLVILYFLPRGRISGQRAKTEVVRPPRGVNSPRTTHHSGLTAAEMSRSVRWTAVSLKMPRLREDRRYSF